MRAARAQSAMEYLMTYGWAILIIAVVLGSLYSLGVFNTANLQPKVGSGGCHVYRPNGPGTAWNINLVGSCQNALPQYVAQFNGKNSSVIAQASSSLNNMVTITVSGWVNPFTNADSGTLVAARTGCGFVNYDLSAYSSYGPTAFIADTDSVSGGVNPAVGVWSFITMTYNGPNGVIYLNGVQTGSSSSLPSMPRNSTVTGIGSDGCPGNYYSGSIANVQIYNVSLSQQAVTALYREGIGGVPIEPQYLVAWWPLNGDLKDYSGNNNNGVPTNVIFNGSWTSGYYH